MAQHAAVLGERALAALRLHQHVEGEELSHDRPSPVLLQHGLHQQDAATCRPQTEEPSQRDEIGRDAFKRRAFKKWSSSVSVLE